METGEGEFYENAGFITDIIHVTSVGENGEPFADFSTQGVQSLIRQDQSQMLQEYTKICEAAGYEFEDLIMTQNDWVRNLMVTFRCSNLRRREYMEGQDTIDGVVYEDFASYERAFMNKYVYEKAYLNEMYKEMQEKASD